MKYLLIMLLPLLGLAQENLQFRNESNLSIIQTGGNSNLETYDMKTESYFNQEKSEYNFGGHYVLGESKVQEGDETIKQETARNWDIHLRYTRTLFDFWGAFVMVKVESDKFSGFERRNNYDLGSRYTIAKTDDFNSLVEFGYRYSEEYPVTEAREGVLFDNKGRIFFEVENKPSLQFSYKFWIEYIPNFTRPEDYLVTLTPSISATLTDIFSMQVSYKTIYDNEPSIEGNEYVDYTFSTALVAKF